MTKKETKPQATTSLMDEPVELQASQELTSKVENKELQKPKAQKTSTRQTNKVGIFKTHKEVKTPTKGSDEAAMFDLYAFLEEGRAIKQLGDDNKEILTHVVGQQVTIHPYSRVMIPTGIKMDIPKGYYVKVYPRSGYSFKNGLGIPNSVGVIDADYRGEVFITLINHTSTRQFLKANERIAQMEIVKADDIQELVEVTEYDDQATERSTGGFGSTGV